MKTRELNGLQQSIERTGHPRRAQDFAVTILQVVSITINAIVKQKDFSYVGWFSKDPRHPDYAPSIFFFSQSTDFSSKLSRLARAQKRSTNKSMHITSGRKAPRVDCDTSNSVGILNSATVRDTCNTEVSNSYNVSTSCVNCEVSSVQDNSSINCNISNADLTDNNFPDVSPVTDMEATETAAVTVTQDNSFREGQQLQAAMEHIMMLTEQNKSLQTQCC